MKSEEIRNYYQQQVGNVPPSIDCAIEHMPQAMAGYMQLRHFITDEANGEGLPARYVGLVFAVLDTGTANYDGALNHARAALNAGLKWRELIQGLVQVWVVHGFASTWGTVGYRVIEQLQKEGFGPKAALPSGRNSP